MNKEIKGAWLLQNRIYIGMQTVEDDRFDGLRFVDTWKTILGHGRLSLNLRVGRRIFVLLIHDIPEGNDS